MLKAEAVGSSKMLVTTYQNTYCHKPEDSNVNNMELDLREYVPEIWNWMSQFESNNGFVWSQE
jgi:hypothetical protein